jgi:hypothetical protein
LIDIQEELQTIRQNHLQGAPVVRMKHLLEPFKEGESLPLFLKNFERTCIRNNIPQGDFAAQLQSILPSSVTEVLARLPDEMIDDYQLIKAELFKHFNFTPGALRQQFITARKGEQESFVQFGFKLQSIMKDYAAESGCRDYQSLLDLVVRDQILQTMPESMRIWVADRITNQTSLNEFGAIADKFCINRNLSPVPFQKSKSDPKKAFNRQRSSESIRCYACQQPGHLSTNCPSKKREPHVSNCIQIHAENVQDNDIKCSNCIIRQNVTKNMENVQLKVNNKETLAFKDTGANCDIVHKSSLSKDCYIGQVAWFHNALQDRPICLPMARVNIQFPAGNHIELVVGVSQTTQVIYPVLLSESSWNKLPSSTKELLTVSIPDLTADTLKKEQNISPKMKESELEY